MVVPVQRRVDANEEATYREAVKSIRETTVGILEQRFHSLELRLKDHVEALTHAVQSARVEAQTANDTLQRLLEAQTASGVKLSDVRFEAQQTAIIRTEAAVKTASEAGNLAIEAARVSAAAALQEVNLKSEMRSDASNKLIDLRARMNEIAVEKATEANEKRFESVNEFRSTLSDQARDFVTSSMLASRTAQLEAQLDGLAREVRASTDGMSASLGSLSNRVTAREVAESSKREVKTDGNLTIGSVVGIVLGGIGVLSFIASLAFNIHSPSSTVATVGADTKRVDDLISRFNDVSARLNSITSPLPGPQK